MVYDQARVEPTIESLQHAADFALEAKVDGFVSVGGGSAMDTAKVANLIVTHPAPVMDYVNPPVGEGQEAAGAAAARTWRSRPPPGPAARRRPSRCSTSRTSSSRPASATATCGRAQAIVDPDLTRTLGPEVTA